MRTGDYFCIEDTNPLIPVNLGDGCIQQEEEFVQVGTDLLEEVKRFLVEYDKRFKVDSFFANFFGYNGINVELAKIYSLHVASYIMTYMCMHACACMWLHVHACGCS